MATGVTSCSKSSTAGPWRSSWRSVSATGTRTGTRQTRGQTLREWTHSKDLVCPAPAYRATPLPAAAGPWVHVWKGGRTIMCSTQDKTRITVGEPSTGAHASGAPSNGVHADMVSSLRGRWVAYMRHPLLQEKSPNTLITGAGCGVQVLKVWRSRTIRYSFKVMFDLMCAGGAPPPAEPASGQDNLFGDITLPDWDLS